MSNILNTAAERELCHHTEPRVFTFQRRTACTSSVFVVYRTANRNIFHFSGEVLPRLEQKELLISDVLLYHRMALLLSPNNSGVESWLCSCYQVDVCCVTMKRICRCLLDAVRSILPETAEKQRRPVSVMSVCPLPRQIFSRDDDLTASHDRVCGFARFLNDTVLMRPFQPLICHH